MIYDQTAAGVDASQELLQKQVSQKEEASEPSELGSVSGNRATKPAELCGDGCVHLRWTLSSEKRFLAVRRGWVDGMQLRCNVATMLDPWDAHRYHSSLTKMSQTKKK